jgi:hypothetical protein
MAARRSPPADRPPRSPRRPAAAAPPRTTARRRAPARPAGRGAPRRGGAGAARQLAIGAGFAVAVAAAVVVILSLRPDLPDPPPATTQGGGAANVAPDGAPLPGGPDAGPPAPATAAGAPRASAGASDDASGGAADPAVPPTAPDHPPAPWTNNAGGPPGGPPGAPALPDGGAPAAAAAPPPPVAPAAPGAATAATADGIFAVPAAGWRLAVPAGWTPTYDAGSEVVELRSGGRSFFVEPVEPGDEGLADRAAAVAMVESFREDGLTVTRLEEGSLPDGFYVAARTTDETGRSEPQLFIVRAVAGRRLLCRLGPGAQAADVPIVRRACASITPL